MNRSSLNEVWNKKLYIIDIDFHNNQRIPFFGHSGCLSNCTSGSKPVMPLTFQKLEQNKMTFLADIYLIAFLQLPTVQRPIFSVIQISEGIVSETLSNIRGLVSVLF